MFSVFLAGAAVLEIHRAIHRPPGDPDVEAVQKREAELKTALEVPALHTQLRWQDSGSGRHHLSYPRCHQVMPRQAPRLEHLKMNQGHMHG